MVETWQERRPQALWRRHSDALNVALLQRWLPDGPLGRVLKTDVFDEAVSDGLYPALAARAKSIVAIDLSRAAARAAQRKYPALHAVPADVRRLPFADRCFDLILSNSTLDHFDQRGDILVGLRELARTLRPGGHLLLTMDNPANPAIWLRGRLPGAWLRGLGVIPYNVGKTCGLHDLQAAACALGLNPLRSTAIMHCPRVLAVAVADWLQGRRPGEQSGFLRLLRAFERLEDLPTRYLTGHFVALLAAKR